MPDAPPPWPEGQYTATEIGPDRVWVGPQPAPAPIPEVVDQWKAAQRTLARHVLAKAALVLAAMTLDDLADGEPIEDVEAYARGVDVGRRALQKMIDELAAEEEGRIADGTGLGPWLFR